MYVCAFAEPSAQPPEFVDSNPELESEHHGGRQFQCVHWELTPHLRLMGAVSGQFNPHISWLLEKLGFSDAQITIPKWIQRGAMDPLDKVIATVVELLVKLTASKKEKLIRAPPQLTQAAEIKTSSNEPSKQS